MSEIESNNLETVSIKPLTGLKVLDFTRLYAGPFCTMLLGDLGADVVKLEGPQGDPTRTQGPPFYRGLGMSFLAGNRNKRSISLDLKKDEGKRLALRLADRADVIVENFRPGTMERLGLGYEAIRRRNPSIVYASISAMGAAGPQSLRGGFDLTVQAEFGYMSISGEKTGGSIKQGTSIFDLTSGLYAYSGILAALFQRKMTGIGQKVETSLMESEVSFLVDAALEYLLSGEIRKKWGSEHAQIVPYKAFKTKDGDIVIGAGYQNVYERFMMAIGREDLIRHELYSTLEARVVNRDQLHEILDKEILNYSTDELFSILDASGVPCAPVNDMSRVFKHPQVLSRGMLMELNSRELGKIHCLGPAVKFSSVDVSDSWIGPPMLGEHTAEVLKDWLS